MNSRAFVLFAGLAISAALPLAAQDQQPPMSVIRTETRVVLVDAVVTDKKGGYISDLVQKDFKVYEDGKEMPIKSFAFEADPNSPLANQKHYLVLFFDNSHMDASGQMRARAAALKFIDANAGANRMMAVANYSGTLQITQNFTTDVDRLKEVVQGVKLTVGPTFGNYGTRNSMLALNTLAKNLSDVQGRKILVLLTGGFAVNDQLYPDVNAAIAQCNKSNVAIYPIDVGGLSTGMPDLNPSDPAGRGRGGRGGLGGGGGVPLALNNFFGRFNSPVTLISSYQAGRPGGAGGSTGSAGAGGGAAGGSSGGGAAAPSGGRSSGGATGAPGGSSGNSGGFGNSGGRSSGANPGTGNGNPGGTGPNRTNTGNNPFGTNNGGRGNGLGGGAMDPNNPGGRGRGMGGVLMPPMPPFASANQQGLYMLADGTGGFVIVNTNDLIGGMTKILKEQDQFYMLTYTPPETAEGSCHTLKVKVDRGGSTVRARTGYCNVKQVDLLSGKPIEKTLEGWAEASKPGTIRAPLQLPFFFTGPNQARVNVAMEIPSEAVKFDKVKGKQHAEMNVMGIAYKKDGSIGARFSDTVKLDFEDKKGVEEFKKTPMHYDTQFDIASGDYNFKLVFAPTGSQDFGKIERPLTVEPFDGKNFAMSQVAMSTEAKPVTDTDAGLDALLTEGRTPLIASNLKITPTGRSHFKSTERVVLYFELYEPANTGEKPPQLAVQLKFFDAKTNEMKLDSGGVPVTKFATAGNPMVAVPLRFPDKLAPGSYRCEFTAVDELNHTATRKLEFDIE